MWKFSKPEQNVIASSSGHKIRLLGRVGIQFQTVDFAVDIDSEMLDPPMSIAVYSNSIPAIVPMERSELLEEVVAGLRSAGFDVEVI